MLYRLGCRGLRLLLLIMTVIDPCVRIVLAIFCIAAIAIAILLIQVRSRRAVVHALRF